MVSSSFLQLNFANFSGRFVGVLGVDSLQTSFGFICVYLYSVIYAYRSLKQFCVFPMPALSLSVPVLQIRSELKLVCLQSRAWRCSRRAFFLVLRECLDYWRSCASDTMTDVAQKLEQYCVCIVLRACFA